MDSRSNLLPSKEVTASLVPTNETSSDGAAVAVLTELNGMFTLKGLFLVDNMYSLLWRGFSEKPQLITVLIGSLVL